MKYNFDFEIKNDLTLLTQNRSQKVCVFSAKGSQRNYFVPLMARFSSGGPMPSSRS